MNAGVVPSFNPDEVPEDIQARASDVLRNELIPSINCDRTLDVTEIIYKASVKNGKVDLMSPPLNYDRIIIGQLDYTFAEIMKYTQYQTTYYPRLALNSLVELGYAEWGDNSPHIVLTDKWPTDNVGKPIDIAFWTSDFKLVEVPTPYKGSDNIQYYDNWYVSLVSDGETVYWKTCEEYINKLYNVSFTPMRVEEVYRASDGSPMAYLHAGEIVSSEFRYVQLAYTVEDLPDVLRIRFTRSFGNGEVLLVLPIPIKVVNSYEEPRPWQGEIIAPEKFRSYLINKLAYRMAIEYGVSTAPIMQQLATESYQSLVKNLSPRHHAQDIPRKIYSYLERGRGWRAGANGSGYVGGYNG